MTGSLGGPAAGPVLAATSDEQVVTIALDTSQESEVKAGDAVTVTLPDGSMTPGVVSSVGTVASHVPVADRRDHHDDPGAGEADRPRSGGNPGPGAGDGVHNHRHRPRRAGGAGDGAGGARPGGYVVEVAGPGSTRRYVPVTPGIFDDNSGLVQVTGALTPGQRVVVAAS